MKKVWKQSVGKHFARGVRRFCGTDPRNLQGSGNLTPENMRAKRTSNSTNANKLRGWDTEIQTPNPF